ncbi:ABC transporter ATP-binding protein [Nesterenkonia sp. MY13]|uniref:ABC transporter ATP-binding protein n=1 Tax=Nesterenkonia sedimenti TaxID=1463632 RepID=A0A7X8YE54_9MICC|nr:ATP-binding cassette domain-containing protein [Nesterenkonia sedimenti]NLS10463.1 ABC transporter ATP-binding protein [Nesterenkonia sedimenti]
MSNRLAFESVSVTYGRGASTFTAVDSVDIAIEPGEILGLVGESGSGKSTLARAAVGLTEPTSGRILLDDVDVAHARGATARERRRIQMVFQDPQSCFDPRRTIGQSLDEALVAASQRDATKVPPARVRREEVASLLEAVSLPAEYAQRMPQQLSGGQRQRVAVARAIAARPSVILADEITSALDVSVQGSVLNLLKDLQRQMGFSVLFISHNLAVVRIVCDRVAVMRKGEVIEVGETLEVMESPQADYTKELIGAVPSL